MSDAKTPRQVRSLGNDVLKASRTLDVLVWTVGEERAKVR